MKLNRWQSVWGLLTLAWLAYWIWVTRDMSFDREDLSFVVRVIILPPLVLYAGGWLVARVIRLVRAHR